MATFARAREASAEPLLQAEALRHEADIHRARCSWPEAIEAARQSAAIAESAGLYNEFAEALNAEATVHYTTGDIERANALYARILELPVNDRIRGIVYQNLAIICIESAGHDAAEKYFVESVEYFRRARYDRGETIALINYGRSRLEQKDVVDAVSLLREAERRALSLADGDLLAMARLNFAEAIIQTGDDERALDLICTALGHFDTTGNAYRRTECLRILGDIHRRRGELDDAISCYQAALNIAESIEARAEIDPLRLRLEAIALERGSVP